MTRISNGFSDDHASHNDTSHNDTSQDLPPQPHLMQQHPHDDLKAFLDRELNPARRLAVRIHLARCAACRKEITAMTQVTEELRADEAASKTETSAATSASASAETATSRAETLAPDLRARILTGIDVKPAEAQAPDAKAPDAKAPDATTKSKARDGQVLMPRRGAPILAWGAIAALVLMFGAATTSLLGSRTQTVFSTANNALSTSTGDDVPNAVYDSSASKTVAAADGAASSAAPGAAPSAGAAATAGESTFADGHVKALLPSRQAGSQFSRGDNTSTMRTRGLDKAKSVFGAAPAVRGSASRVVEDSLAPSRSIYKEASITVEVSDLEKQTDEVERMVKNAGGFIADNDLETGQNGLRRSQMLIKVPAGQFETMLKTVGALGIVKSKKVNGEDITARLSDARQAKLVLTNQLQAQVERLKKAAKKDKAQERYEARMIQVQVAQARARFNILNRLATLSTMTVQLREKTAPTAASQTGFLDELGKTRNAAMASFMIAARLPVMLLMWILAYSPLWIPLFIAWRIALHLRPRRVP